MNTMDEKYSRLRDRAERTFAGHPVVEVIDRTRAIIGLMHLPADETDAQQALDTLRRGEEPTAVQLAALELMVRLMRPAPLSKKGELQPLPEQNEYNEELINAWNDFRGRVRIYLGSIGRIDRGNGEAVGTGFLIADDLLITNLHVVHELAFGAEKLERGQAVINFQQEYECLDDNGETEIISCIAVHRTLDLALLRINKASDRSPLLLDTATPLGPGIRIAAVGYPAEESDRNPIFIAPVYDGIFGVKRGAPGEILDVEHPIVYHDCSTLGGSSGSPLFSLATARVVGVHRNGVFMYQNEAADAASLECFVREHG